MVRSPSTDWPVLPTRQKLWGFLGLDPWPLLPSFLVHGGRVK